MACLGIQCVVFVRFFVRNLLINRSGTRSRFIPALVVLSLLGLSACENGGSSSGGDEPTPTPAPSFSLGGQARGLKNLDIVTIHVEGQERDITREGNFVFLEQLATGTEYSVFISALPDGLVCEVQNSTGVITEDVNDLVVDCASMLTVPVISDVPARGDADKLRLFSNFESTATPVGESQIRVAPNSTVSMVEEQGEILYLSYIDNLIDERGFQIGPRSTAIALVLLEPSIVSAIRTVGEVPELMSLIQLVEDANDSPDRDLDKLSVSIEEVISADGSLISPSTQMIQDLAKVIENTLAYITLIDTPSLSKTAVSHSLAKLQSSGSLDGVGAEVQYSKVAGETNVDISTNNMSERFVSFESNVSELFLVPPQSEKSLSLENGVDQQNTIEVTISGPGRLGEVDQEKITGLVTATAGSAVTQFLYPSIATLLGLQNPELFELQDCLGDASTNTLVNEAALSFDQFDILISDEYYQVFTRMAADARLEFVSDARGEPFVEELFDCDKFGIGVFIESQKYIALDNTRTILETLNTIYTQVSQSYPYDVFVNDQISPTVESINASESQKTWSLSNEIRLEVNSSQTGAFANQVINFTAQCFNPKNNLVIKEENCDVQWAFGDNSFDDGHQVSHSYNSPGNYLVVANATDSDGASQSQSINIVIADSFSAIAIQDQNGTDISNGGVPYDVGNISLGATETIKLNIVNEGNIELTVEGVSDNSDLVEVSLPNNLTIDPGNSQVLNIEITPDSLGEFNAQVYVDSNDPGTSRFTVNLTGQVIEQATETSLTVDRDGSSEIISVPQEQVTATYNQSENTVNVRIFLTEGGNFPQVSITLTNYNPNTNTRANGLYLFDDDGSRDCLGFYANDISDEKERFCTSTSELFGPSMYTGSATVSTSIEDPSIKVVEFVFEAITREACLVDENSCETITINGNVLFNEFGQN